MSEVRIYMRRGDSDPILFDNSGRGWFYIEDDIAREHGEDWQLWVRLTKDCFDHKEQDAINRGWKKVGEL